MVGNRGHKLEGMRKSWETLRSGLISFAQSQEALRSGVDKFRSKSGDFAQRKTKNHIFATIDAFIKAAKLKNIAAL